MMGAIADEMVENQVSSKNPSYFHALGSFSIGLEDIVISSNIGEMRG